MGGCRLDAFGRDPENCGGGALDRLLGIVVAVFAGWLGLLAPASSAIENVTSIGFVGFFVFMAAMGIALLRRG
jgi:hypothetical protein